jgi:hypothetical protein
MTELDLFLQDGSLKKVINDTTDYYMEKVKTHEGSGHLHLDFEDDVSIPYSAFFILSLINQPDYPNSLETAVRLAEGIMSLQQPDGSYFSDFNGGTIGIDYYPGESMLSLMRLYETTKDERLIDSVKKAFPYYRDYWRENKNTAFVPWHTQAYFLVSKYDPDEEMESFIYEMNDWVIETYQIFNDIYPDKIGGFFKEDPRCSTSSYMESINDAYGTALLFSNRKQIKKYRESIRKGTRFILQLQFTLENTFWLKNPTRAIGGFKESLKRATMRNDYTQHAVSALLKTFRNNIFS